MFSVSEPNLHKTDKTHSPSLICQFCHTVFTCPEDLDIHKKLIHTGANPYNCGACGKSFKSKCGLGYHLRTHTGEKPNKCGTDEKSFSDEHGLFLRLRNNTGEKPYTFETCGKSFDRKTNSDKHNKRFHKGKKFHSWQVCGKMLRGKSNLYCHMRIHTGDKPYCWHLFTSKSNLLQHEKIHSREKPYSCEICGKSFNRKE